MIVQPPDLDIFGVYDRGVANKERIVLRVNRPVDLSQHFLFLGVRGPMNSEVVFPIPDQFIWLGNGILDAPSWVFLYTGKGTPTVTRETNTNQPLQYLYWNKTQVALNHPDIIPVLIHSDQLLIGNKPNQSIEDLNKPKWPNTEDWAQLLSLIGQKSPPEP